MFARSLAGLRWDRLGRIGLLVVLAVVGVLYVERTLNYLSTKAQADHQQSVVHQLISDNARLTREQQSLNQPATIAADARKLGMVKIGEHPYVMTGLPNR